MIDFLQRHRRINEESGFTLAEVIAAVVIAGILAGGIGALLIGTLKGATDARARLDTSASEQLLGYWLPADMQSVGLAPSDFSNDPGTPTGCSDAGTGTNALRLRWKDQSTNDVFFASYRIETQADGSLALVRRVCKEGQAAATSVLVTNIKDVSSVIAVDDRPSRILMTVTVLIGGKEATFQITARPRTTGAATPGGPGTTIPGFDPPCTGSFNPVSPNPVGLTGANPGPLQSGVLISAQTAGGCGAISVSISNSNPGNFAPGVGTATLTETSIGSGSWANTVGAGVNWRSGTYTVTLLNGGASLSPAVTTQFNVSQPCSLTALQANPVSVQRAAYGGSSPNLFEIFANIAEYFFGGSPTAAEVLKADVVLTGATSGVCTEPSITATISPTNVNGTVRNPGVSSVSLNWNGTAFVGSIRGGSGQPPWFATTWTGVTAAYPVSTTLRGVTQNASFKVDIWRPCDLAATLLPTTKNIYQVSGTGLSRKLKALTPPDNPGIFFTTNSTGFVSNINSCTALNMRISSTDTPPVVPPITKLDLIPSPLPNGDTTWVGKILADDRVWPKGNYKAQLYDGEYPVGYGAFLAQDATFTVLQGCTVTAVNVNSPVRNTSTNFSPAPLASNVVVDAVVTDAAACGAPTALTGVITGPNPLHAPIPLNANGDYTITPDATTWGTGNYNIALSDAGTPVAGWPTGNFTITGRCQVSSVAASPNSVAQVAGSGNRALTAAVGVTVKTVGECGPMTVDVLNPTNGVVESVALTGAPLFNPTTWTGSIAANGSSYGTGIHTIKAKDNGTNVASWPTDTFTVIPGCTANPFDVVDVAQVAGSAATRTLKAPISISVNTTSSNLCGALTAVITGTGVPAGASPVTLSAAGGGVFAGTIGAGAYAWPVGTFTVSLRNDGNVVPTFPTDQFAVTAGCSVTGVGVAPVSGSAISLASSANPGLLAGGFTINAAGPTTPPCGALTAVITGQAGATVGLTPVTLNGTGDGTVNPAVGQNWSVGNYTVAIREAGNAISGWPNGSFAIQPGCTATALTALPGSVAQESSGGSSRPLANSVALSATTSGTCTLSAEVRSSSNAILQTITFSGNGGIIGANATSYATGTYTVILRNNGVAFAPAVTAQFVVTAPCALTSVSVNPSTALQVAGSSSFRPLTGDVTVSVVTTGTCANLGLQLRQNNQFNNPVIANTAIRSGGPSNWTFILDADGPNGSGGWDVSPDYWVYVVEGTTDLDNGSNSYPAQLRITQGCSLSNLSATDAVSGSTSLRQRSAANPSALLNNLSLQSSTDCSNLTALITGPGVPAGFANPVTLNSNGDATVAANASQLWTAGLYTVAWRQNGVTVPGITMPTFTVTQGCSVTNLGAVGSPVNQAIGSGSTRALATDVTLNATGVSGSCSLSGVVRGPSGNTFVQNVTFSGNSGTITAFGPALYAPGSYTVTLLDSGVVNPSLTASANFTVNASCSLSNLTATDSVTGSTALKQRSSVNPGALRNNLSLSSTTTCTNLSVLLSGPGVPGGVTNPVNLDASGDATVAANAGQLWTASASPYTATWRQNGVTIPGFTMPTFTVTQGCSVTGLNASPGSVAMVAGSAPRGLASTVTLTATGVSGSCALTGVVTGPGGSTFVQNVNFSGNSGQILANGPSIYNPGTYTVTLLDNNAANPLITASTTFTVTQPCTLLSIVTPNEQAQVAASSTGGDFRALYADFAVTVTTTGCANPLLVLDQGSAPTIANTAARSGPVGPNQTWTFTLSRLGPNGSGGWDWSPDYRTRVFENGTADLSGPTGAIVINRGCTVDNLTVSSSVSNAGGGAAPLLGSIAIDGSVSNCDSAFDDLTARVTAGTGTMPVAPVPYSVSLNESNGTGSIVPTVGQNWGLGTYTVTIYNNGVAIPGAPTGTFTVTQGCSVSSGPVLNPVSPSSFGRVTGNGSSRGLVSAIRFDVTAAGDCAGKLAIRARTGNTIGGTQVVTTGSMSNAGGNTWTVSIPAGTSFTTGTSFAGGNHTGRVVNGGVEQSSPNVAFTISEGCTISSLTDSGSVTQAGFVDPGPASSNVTLTLTLGAGASGCGAFTATVSPSNPLSPSTLTFSPTGNPSVFTSTVSTSVGAWNSTTFTAQLREGGVNVSGVTTSFDVNPNTTTCTVALNAQASASPSTVANNTNGSSASTLQAPVTITVTATGNCNQNNQLTVQIRPNGSSTPAYTTGNLTWVSGTTWQFVVPAGNNSAQLAAGQYTLRIRQNGSSSGSTTNPVALTVT